MYYNTLMIVYVPLFVQCDLIPAWATKGWLRTLSRDYPTLAFHASINKSFGKVFFFSIVLRLSCSCTMCTYTFEPFPGISSFSIASVCPFEEWQTSHIRWICWISQCWEVISYQHIALQNCNSLLLPSPSTLNGTWGNFLIFFCIPVGLQGSSDSWRDKGVAVHHHD
jgi:hypothetical protein